MNENSTMEPTGQLRFILPDAPRPSDTLIGSVSIARHWPAILQQAFINKADGGIVWRTVPLTILPLDEYEAAMRPSCTPPDPEA